MFMKTHFLNIELFIRNFSACLYLFITWVAKNLRNFSTVFEESKETFYQSIEKYHGKMLLSYHSRMIVTLYNFMF